MDSRLPARLLVLMMRRLNLLQRNEVGVVLFRARRQLISGRNLHHFSRARFPRLK
jgi:hypothetical protein